MKNLFIVLAVISLIVLAFGCTTKKKLLREIREVKAQLTKIDSTYNSNRIQLYNLKKKQINEDYKEITPAELLRRVDALTEPKRDH